MSALFRLVRRSAAGVALAGVLLGALAAGAQPAKDKTDPLVPKDGDDVSTSHFACAACHATDTATQKNNPFANRFKSHEFVRLNEATTWRERDPHSVAFEALGGPLAKRMGEVLKYDVRKAAQCLTCHATSWTTRAGTTNFEASEGVSCTACHGVRKGWQSEHFADREVGERREIAWRGWAPEKKEEYGMRNLRDPVVTARLCASCHVGSAAEGKVITHEMYVAGHPPLPPFELVSFLEAMPRHWDHPTDERLKYFASVPAADTWKLFRFHPAERESRAARWMAAGAIAGFRAEVEMVAADAKRSADFGEGIDTARFDCVVCHHDLKQPIPRRWAGPPGRPHLRVGAADAARVIADHTKGVATPRFADRAAGFDARWEALHKAATAKFGGDPKKTAEAADAAVEWCDRVLALHAGHSEPLYTPAEAKRLRELIVREAAGAAGRHPEAATWLAWAYVELADEAKVASRADVRKVLAGVIPVAPRTEPFSTPDREPARGTAGWAKGIADFRPQKYAEAVGRWPTR